MTRYPKSGRGHKWTVKALESIPVDWKGDSLSDGNGLTGEIRVTRDSAVSIRFKYAFKWDGKVVWHQCGTWPTVTLEKIRTNRDHARILVKTGVNPVDHKKADRIEKQAQVLATIARAELENTENLPFLAMYEKWLASGVVRKDGNDEIRRSFEKDVLPAIGNMPVKNITENELNSLLLTIVRRGANRMAGCVHADLVQLFGWAEKRQPWRKLMLEGNPADLVEIRKVYAPNYDPDDERDRVLSPADLRELHTIFLDMEKAYNAAPVGAKNSVSRPVKKETQLALWICLSTMCRIGELLMTEWIEVDLNHGVWAIPVENVKGQKGKKQPQTVSLSHFALEQFKALHAITGHTPYCFPARHKDDHVCVKSVSKTVGDCQTRFKSRTKPLKNRRNDNSLVLNGGKDGEWTPHDLRRTGSTAMQALGIELHVIDRCQNHVLEGSKVRRSYMHHDYFEEKRNAWHALGEYLESVFQG